MSAVGFSDFFGFIIVLNMLSAFLVGAIPVGYFLYFFFIKKAEKKKLLLIITAIIFFLCGYFSFGMIFTYFPSWKFSNELSRWLSIPAIAFIEIIIITVHQRSLAKNKRKIIPKNNKKKSA